MKQDQGADFRRERLTINGALVALGLAQIPVCPQHGEECDCWGTEDLWWSAETGEVHQLDHRGDAV